MKEISPRELFKKGLWGAGFALLVTGAAIYFLDGEKIWMLMTGTDTTYLCLAMLCALGVYSGRFIKWCYFLKVLSISVPFTENLSIFLSGLALGITPGKVGEVFKCYLLKRLRGVDFAYTAPTIVGERLTGVLGCFLLCLVSLAVVGADSAYGYGVAIATILVVAGTLAVFRWPLLGEWFFQRMEGIKLLKKYAPSCRAFYRSAVQLLGFNVISVAVLISVVYWFLECLLFYCLLQGMAVNFSLAQTVMLLTVISIGGGLTLLPGSVGALEGGMIGLLMYYGVDTTTAGAVTLLHRFFAMWGVVIIGWVVLLIVWRRIWK